MQRHIPQHSLLDSQRRKNKRESPTPRSPRNNVGHDLLTSDAFCPSNDFRHWPGVSPQHCGGGSGGELGLVHFVSLSGFKVEILSRTRLRKSCVGAAPEASINADMGPQRLRSCVYAGGGGGADSRFFVFPGWPSSGQDFFSQDFEKLHP